ncbi:MAG: transposon-transfer assisting family protein [bacterium]|nr:transposon-transfer assisting family protein [bacterium]
MKNFTQDELNLMSIYNAGGTREGLLRELREMRGYLTSDEADLRTLTDSAIEKLEAISDEEYAGLDLFPEFD